MDAFFAALYEAYQRALRAYNAVDFDDLILLPVSLLRDNAALRERWQNRIRYLLVDEYQDTNGAQYELVRLLVGVRADDTLSGVRVVAHRETPGLGDAIELPSIVGLTLTAEPIFPTDPDILHLQRLHTPNANDIDLYQFQLCLLYTSPSPRDGLLSRMPSSA